MHNKKGCYNQLTNRYLHFQMHFIQKSHTIKGMKNECGKLKDYVA